jgi:hypothetical protein
MFFIVFFLSVSEQGFLLDDNRLALSKLPLKSQLKGRQYRVTESRDTRPES